MTDAAARRQNCRCRREPPTTSAHGHDVCVLARHHRPQAHRDPLRHHDHLLLLPRRRRDLRSCGSSCSRRTDGC